MPGDKPADRRFPKDEAPTAPDRTYLPCPCCDGVGFVARPRFEKIAAVIERAKLAP